MDSRLQASTRAAEHVSTRFSESFDRRVIEAEEFNRRLDDPSAPAQPPRTKRIQWAWQALRPLPQDVLAFAAPGSSDQKSSFRQRRKTLEDEWRGRSGRRKASVVWALNDCMEGFWAGGLFKVVGDTATLMSPLLTKELIKFSQAGEWRSEERPSIDSLPLLASQCMPHRSLARMAPTLVEVSGSPSACSS